MNLVCSVVIMVYSLMIGRISSVSFSLVVVVWFELIIVMVICLSIIRYVIIVMYMNVIINWIYRVCLVIIVLVSVD